MKNLLFRLRYVFFLGFLVFLSGCAGGNTDTSGSGTGGGGSAVLSMTIYSPYGNVIDEDEQSYYDGESKTVSKSVVTSRYRDYGEAYGASLGFSDEPYCRIGGTYKINVKNKNRFGNYNADHDLYYCKTTLDLINQIQIPSSWTDDELTLYCNDGNLINFAEFNLDFLTTKLNHYKVCILKNEELAEENTIVYGYEVGNKRVDSDADYNFNPNGDNFIFSDEDIEITGTQGGLVEKQVEYISIPYQNWNYGCSDGSGYNTMFSIQPSLVGGIRPAPGPGSTCYSLQEMQVQQEGFCFTDQCSTSRMQCVSSSCDVVTPTIRAAYPNADLSSVRLVSQQGYKDSEGSFVQVNVNGENVYGLSWYRFNVDVSFSVTDYIFTQDTRTFYFGYDESSTYYNMRETTEALNTPLTSVFNIPNEFGLSRVAMFRSDGATKKVYGYEHPAKYKIGGEDKSVKAVYTVSFTNNFNFKQTDCVATLASYGSTVKSTLSNGDTIICASNNKMLLNSQAIDSIYSPGITLTLFKNIILNLE